MGPTRFTCQPDSGKADSVGKRAQEGGPGRMKQVPPRPGEELIAGDGGRKTCRSARGSIRDVSGTHPRRSRADPPDTRTADNR